MEMIYPEVDHCVIRAGFPTAGGMRQAFRRRSTLEESVHAPGYIPPTAQYCLRGSDTTYSIALRETDLPLLAQRNAAAIDEYVSLVIAARRNLPEAAARLDALAMPLIREKGHYYENLRLIENRFVVPSLTEREHTEASTSSKGAMLITLYRDGYPVPDFSILTSESYTADRSTRERSMLDGIANLEALTECRLSSPRDPLLIAMRCAMPSYIPGFMPTYLNVGATESSFSILERKYGRTVALKVYLNNLQNIHKLLFPESQESGTPAPSQSSPAEIERTIDRLAAAIRSKEPGLLADPVRQVAFFIQAARDFFRNNRDLLFTFTRGKDQFPSLIMQKMVLTVRDEASYSGMLSSRHPRTGRGMLIECARNIFGEEIMTGTVPPESKEFFDPSEIRDSYPAVTHFVPLLKQLERKFATAVAIEFAAETTGSVNLFALLQLNPSEMTGRATLVSAMDMLHGGIIPVTRITELVKPYHLRQISSDSIHESSFATLRPFAKGVSLLPRSAVTAQAYFSASTALAAKKRGEKVCFCKQGFIPSDTIVMGEMDAMISLTPAAIHVVTACRGAGIPAFLNLESHGVTIRGKSLVNGAGMEIGEGDWITLSSKRQEIYLGRATYTPARFQKYLDGEPIELSPREKLVFEIMVKAFRQYRSLMQELKVEQIENINDLIRLVRNDLRADERKATEIVNAWYAAGPAYYAEQVLQSEMGAHLDQHMIFDRLTTRHRIDFFQRTIARCQERKQCGFSAGAFMLGRFLSNRQPVEFWQALREEEILFALNEWVLFEKYMQVLYEVGERRIGRARDRILNEGLGSLLLNPGDMKVFITLKLAARDLARIGATSGLRIEPETPSILLFLEQPLEAIFPRDLPWELHELRRVCAENGIPLPAQGAG